MITGEIDHRAEQDLESLMDVLDGDPLIVTVHGLRLFSCESERDVAVGVNAALPGEEGVGEAPPSHVRARRANAW